MARIALASVRKIGLRNRPTVSRHELRRLRDLPHRHIRRLPTSAQAFAYPFEPARADLVHSFSLVPLVRTPWVGTFGQYLPRPVAPLSHPLLRLADRQVASDRCRALIAQSDYARRVCLDWHRDCDHHDLIADKIEVVHAHQPHIDRASLPERAPAQQQGSPGGEVLRMAFVGLDFARKGGIVALRVARLAQERGLPVELEIVSGMDLTTGWVDHPDRRRYDADLALLELPNVVHHGRLPHRDTLGVLARADVQVMCTLDDNFGYSVLEGFALGVPSIATAVGALPEMVEDDRGVLVPLETNELGQWVGREQWGALTADLEPDSLRRRDSDEYWSLLDRTWDELAEQVLPVIEGLLEDRSRLAHLGAGAAEAANGPFSPEFAAAAIDDIYDRALTA